MELQEQKSSSNSVVPKGELVTNDYQDKVLPGQPNLSYQVSMTHNVTIKEDAMQENPSYQRGHVTVKEDAMQVQENPSYRVNRTQNVIGVEEETTEVTSGENREMTTNTNIAYNTATQLPDQNNEYHYVPSTENTTQNNQGNSYSEIIADENSIPFYEEIPNNRKALPPTTDQLLAMSVLTTKTMCSFWQGRLEIYIREATLVVS